MSLPAYRQNEIYHPFEMGKEVYTTIHLPVRFSLKKVATPDHPKAIRIHIQVGRDIIVEKLGSCEWIRYSDLSLSDIAEAIGQRYGDYQWRLAGEEYIGIPVSKRMPIHMSEVCRPFDMGKEVFIIEHLPVRFSLKKVATPDHRMAIRIHVQVGRDMLAPSVGRCEWIRYSDLDLYEMLRALDVRYGDYVLHLTEEEQQMPYHGKTWKSEEERDEAQEWGHTMLEAELGDYYAKVLVSGREGYPQTQEEHFYVVDRHVKEKLEDLPPPPKPVQKPEPVVLSELEQAYNEDLW